MSDLLPEETEYRDEGCRVHPSCLSCPLPACIYEERYSVRQGRLARRRASLRARDMEIVARYRAGETSREIADTYGLSPRQVFRILAIEKTTQHRDGAMWMTSSNSGASWSTRGLPRTA